MQALQEIGLRRAARFFYLTLLMAFYNNLLFPPLRKWFLKLFGARIGRNVILHRVKFFNVDRKGFRGLKIGNNVFIGDECLLDLAEGIELADHVTLAERVTVLTHMNVGYKDHPLQKDYPSVTAPVKIRRGCFIGACATLLAGVEIGERSLVAAGSVVTRHVPNSSVVGGVPARDLKQANEDPSLRSG